MSDKQGSEVPQYMIDRHERLHAPCDCYKCVGPKHEWTQEHGRVLMNDLERHTFLAPCPDCGRPRTEYRDLGTKGRYVCWWCRERAAGPAGPSPAPPTGARTEGLA